MATKVSNFSDLIHRVTANCLLHPLAGVSRPDDISIADDDDDDDDHYENAAAVEDDVEEEEDFRIGGANWEDAKHGDGDPTPGTTAVMELQLMMSQVFEAVSAMKRAYVSIQEAHCPWDPDKMRVADVAVLAELRRLGLLRERFRRSVGGGGGGGGGRWGMGAVTVREVVAPYEAAMEQLKREVKAKQAEVENLREKLKTATSFDRGGKSKGKSKRRVSCTTQGQFLKWH